MKLLLAALVLPTAFFGCSLAFNAIEDVKFLLFTRNNPTTPQQLRINDVASITESNFNINQSVKLIIHGWMADSTHVFTPMTTEAYLKQNDANVIAFDWGVAANDSNYLRSRNRINEAGRVGASFLDFLVINRLMKYEDCTLVGYSLGAHLAGMIGKHTRYGLVEIIIGLDPAGAFFDINNPTTRLTTTDAFYVEIIHTNGGGLGIGNPIGHADFYPNGGRNQPGCENDDGCSHGRSFRMFAESINSNNFGAFRCQRFDQIICLGEPRGFMGDPNNAELRLRGFFRLLTNSEAPFARG